ncbi:TPA: glycosyltransferase, partial [Mannheimia haemolytica]|nr:glycosyltransferase [Mannheimia haemolytica]HEB5593726.1 glycosyltransferase [Mannheimia haemolytica]
MNKKISVVMSTYNEPVEWVEKSIRSILNQTYDNIEVIVICDNPDNKGIVD